MPGRVAKRRAQKLRRRVILQTSGYYVITGSIGGGS
jgi:hypothetical protein